MTDLRDQHEPTDACIGVHCHSHGIDEAGDGYIGCYECGHLYRTAGELRRAYRRKAAEIALSDLRNPHHWARTVGTPLATRLAAVASLVRLPFIRAGRIGFCQECIHDF